jgi:hypothetical protein
MFRPSCLRDIACANARTVLANVVWSFRRSGKIEIARSILRNARESGTYPAPARAEFSR